jgi:sporulation protein YlmC with PRC-barrel domain
MDIPLNAKVSCLDGPCGKSTYLVLMPTTEEITHVVVRNHSFPETEYLVPVGRIAESTPETIQLNCNHEELSKMPVFNQVEFIPSGLNGTYGIYSMLWPYSTPGVGFIEIDSKQIPANELAIRRGASVEATDGHIGRVDEFLINPIDNAITHLVLREGHLWGQKNITIPMSQIDRIEENTVWLKLDKQRIEALPAIPIHHGRINKE